MYKIADFVIKKYYKGYYRYKGLKYPQTTIIDVRSVFLNGNNIEIEDYCYIGPFAYINGIGGIDIKSGSLIGPYVKILSASHNYKSLISIPYDHVILKNKITIQNNVWIGAGVTILPGVEIGEGAIVGAGTLVNKNIEPFSIVVGNPARVVGYRDVESYNKLKETDSIYLKIKSSGK